MQLSFPAVPGSRAAQNLQMPAPGTEKRGQMPRSSPGSGGGGGFGGWAQLELTDALLYCVTPLWVYKQKAL